MSPSRAVWPTEPSLLLADEPTGNLDSENAHAVLDLIIGLQQEQGRTMVLVTHDRTIAERAGRILHMMDGRIVSDECAKRMTFFTVVIRGLWRRPLRTGIDSCGNFHRHRCGGCVGRDVARF